MSGKVIPVELIYFLLSICLFAIKSWVFMPKQHLVVMIFFRVASFYEL